MTPLSFFRKVLKILNPLPLIGGLSITDDAVRLLLLEEGKPPRTAAVRLAPGIFKEGKIANREGLKTALENIHREVGSRGKSIHVVFSLPPAAVYTQSFSVPYLEGSRLEESAHLNLEMLSPIDFSVAYAGWQRIGESSAEGMQIDLLGAFVESSLVKEFAKILNEVGFTVAAVEFPSLALARLAARDPQVLPFSSYLFSFIATDGIALMVIKNHNLYFSHFHSWKEVREEEGGRDLALSDVKSYLSKEVQKVLNFYSGRWGGTVDGILLAATSGAEECAKILGETFSLPVQQLTPKILSTLSPAWFPVLGSAMRGALPRFEDTFLSLTDEPVQVQYREARMLRFTSVWRNVMLTASIFILAIFLGGERFLAGQASQLEHDAVSTPPEAIEIAVLKKEAQSFNDLVDLVFGAQKDAVRWSPFFALMNSRANGKVTLTRIAVEFAGASLAGTGAKTENVLAFRDELNRDSHIEKLDVPLKNIKERPDGSVDFSLTFKFKFLQF